MCRSVGRERRRAPPHMAGTGRSRKAREGRGAALGFGRRGGNQIFIDAEVHLSHPF